MQEGQKYIRNVSNPSGSGDIVKILSTYTVNGIKKVKYEILEGNSFYFSREEGDVHIMVMQEFKSNYRLFNNSIEKIKKGE